MTKVEFYRLQASSNVKSLTFNLKKNFSYNRSESQLVVLFSDYASHFIHLVLACVMLCHFNIC